jgi:hypothetical protein
VALFAAIPDTLFSPLASPGAPIYAEALVRIFAETRRHQQPLSRDLTVSLICEVLAEIGVMILGTLNNGLTLLSVNAYYQEIVRGLVLLLAVALDQIRKRDGA